MPGRPLGYASSLPYTLLYATGGTGSGLRCGWAIVLVVARDEQGECAVGQPDVDEFGFLVGANDLTDI